MRVLLAVAGGRVRMAEEPYSWLLPLLRDHSVQVATAERLPDLSSSRPDLAITADQATRLRLRRLGLRVMAPIELEGHPTLEAALAAASALEARSPKEEPGWRSERTAA